MGYVGNAPAEKYTTIDKQTLTGNSTVGPYTLTHSVGNEQEIEVFVNNVRQEPGVSYTVSSNQLTMSASVASADDFYVIFQGKAKMTATHPPTFDLTAANGTFTGTVTTGGLTVGSDTAKTKFYSDSTYNGIYNGSSLTNNESIYMGSGTLFFYSGGGERMRINASGNVGIGTSSPASKLHIYATSYPGIRLDDGTAYSTIYNDSTDGSLVYSADDQNARANSKQLFYVDGSERMRIDSSGNLLVGTTSTTLTGNAGFTYQGGITTTSNNGLLSAIMNRNTNDGDIVQFRKDNSTVGSIGTFGGTTYFSSNSHAIMINGFTITPSLNTGNRVDNAMDLGSSVYRFKDLYLSGGVYLAGTGSANKLDHYEEGTWDPTLLAVTGSFGSITYDAFTKGAYTRIGRVVYITGTIRTDAITVGTAGTGVQVSGLPFTVAANDPTTSRNMISPLALSDQTSFANDSPNRAEFTTNQTTFILQKQSSIASNIALLLPSDLGTGANANRLAFSGFYFTDA